MRRTSSSRSSADSARRAAAAAGTGALAPGVYAKDVILAIIRRLGVKGGVGYAYEYGGEAVSRMSMEERMTLCNMSVEGGARAGYVNPDATTFAYLKGRPAAPSRAPPGPAGGRGGPRGPRG